LHRFILQVLPGCKLWFLDGKNSENKTVSNPNIGYGLYTIKYADGKTREFYQIGLGKASVSGYCIKFKALKDINIDILGAAIRYGVEVRGEKG
jgi:hypothetical protein